MVRILYILFVTCNKIWESYLAWGFSGLLLFYVCLGKWRNYVGFSIAQKVAQTLVVRYVQVALPTKPNVFDDEEIHLTFLTFE
ncbi:hypothetical protein L2E82_26351 [Cichorium intybus]|uniref:Uncharacterized protein n=1 Tax=Cichorium intybus TaxID=13427 RepID=A0ACB9CQL8_CICIN|nr:hypothetical protein L2E82_26351 [Cichorium intybus]